MTNTVDYNSPVPCVNGVTVGDKFHYGGPRKQPHVAQVVDIYQKRSLVTGDVIGYECVCKMIEHGEFTATNRFILPFASVIRNRIKSSEVKQ